MSEQQISLKGDVDGRDGKGKKCLDISTTDDSTNPLPLSTYAYFLIPTMCHLSKLNFFIHGYDCDLPSVDGKNILRQ